MAAPYEIVANPLTLYVAPVGESFPAIDAAVAGNWFKVGTSGTRNYEDEGVTVSHDQSLEFFRGAGETGPRKAFRTEEDLMFGLTLVDLGPEQYAKAMDDASVTTIAQSVGVAGNKRFSIQQGLVVSRFALLARGLSTVDDALSAQFECPIAVQAGSPAPTFEKGGPAGLELSYQALVSDSTGFGVLRIQTTIAG